MLNFDAPEVLKSDAPEVLNFNTGLDKLHNFCARLNPFLGVYGKNEDYHRLRFFVLFVVVYFVFSVDAFFMEKIAKQNRLFSAFFKKAKTCLMEMALAPSFFKLWGF